MASSPIITRCGSPMTPSGPMSPSVVRSPSPSPSPPGSPTVFREFSMDALFHCSSAEGSREQSPMLSLRGGKDTATKASSTTSVLGDEQEACSAPIRKDKAPKGQVRGGASKGGKVSTFKARTGKGRGGNPGKKRKYDPFKEEELKEILRVEPAEPTLPEEKKLRKVPLKSELQAMNDRLQEKVTRLEREIEEKALQRRKNESAIKTMEKSLFEMMVKGGGYACVDCHQ